MLLVMKKYFVRIEYVQEPLPDGGHIVLSNKKSTIRVLKKCENYKRVYCSMGKFAFQSHSRANIVPEKFFSLLI